MSTTLPVALTIAGSDSGGGAGIQADIKTFSRFRVFGTSAITAVTAQNTIGVAAWEPVSVDLVRAQIEAVFRDLKPAAVKTGMIGSAAVAKTVVETLTKFGSSHLVVDPVMVATSGDILLDEDAVTSVRDELIRISDLVTPNLDEVKVILGYAATNLEEMQDSARDLVSTLGARAALVKGGHLPGDIVPDVLYDGSKIHIFRNARLYTDNVHGTGCTLSAAIAANLAHGESMYEAVSKATHYVHHAIATAPNLGSGHGPLNHFA